MDAVVNLAHRNVQSSVANKKDIEKHLKPRAVGGCGGLRGWAWPSKEALAPPWAGPAPRRTLTSARAQREPSPAPRPGITDGPAGSVRNSPAPHPPGSHRPRRHRPPPPPRDGRRRRSGAEGAGTPGAARRGFRGAEPAGPGRPGGRRRDPDPTRAAASPVRRGPREALGAVAPHYRLITTRLRRPHGPALLAEKPGQPARRLKALQARLPNAPTVRRASGPWRLPAQEATPPPPRTPPRSAALAQGCTFGAQAFLSLHPGHHQVLTASSLPASKERRVTISWPHKTCSIAGCGGSCL
ncbi:uncharacterized protein LOC141585550 [Saimiri boliviensis]|uniref:uncharacterized protein LOC141585550 n=1 Tax=Saimiri boliviensis TaxID=27679 RepID=UPI003D78287B